MAKTKNAQFDLLAMAGELTAQATAGKSGGSGVTYLDRFVNVLLDENGKPTSPKSRRDVINEISVEMFLEIRASDIAAGRKTKAGDLVKEIDFTKDADGHYNCPADVEEFKVIAKKVKNQVAAAIANNQNSTSVSFNPKYKDIWRVAKHAGGLVSLEPVTGDDDTANEIDVEA